MSVDWDEVSTVSVEYAKTNRSKCRECEESIDKDLVRVALGSENNKNPKYYHLSCLELAGNVDLKDVEGLDDLDEDDNNEVKKLVQGKKRKASSDPAVPTKKKDAPAKKAKSEDQKKLKEIKEALNSKTMLELKEMLRENNQKVTGVKADLVDRISDGMVHGQLPKCPKCFGGFLNFNSSMISLR
eukprot:TRINITY_DN1070_c0_g1_i1.p1 TRINITY_DN1070_c0_g1~~TRINITY_DN1070_c0_g1_i1.p1  ORF type:complete len:185 (+),score=49.89 TRINITY_DN1070_c0_g1_i1:47-601(+)